MMGMKCTNYTLNTNIRYFPFGRYKFQEVRQVAIHNPRYIIWWDKNVQDEELSNEIISLANKYILNTKVNR